MSFWREIAEDLGIARTGTGSWQRRIAIALGAEDTPGNSWEEKIARFVGIERTQGSWAKRMVPEDEVLLRSAIYSAWRGEEVAAGEEEANYSPSLDFSDLRNSQYLPLIFGSL